MIVAELLASLGIQLDNKSWTEANAALEVLKKGFEAAMNVIEAGLEAVNKIGEVGLQAAEIEKTATALGMTADELQRLQGAAYLADVTAEQLTTAMGRLAIVTAEAGDGGKEALESLEGITFKGTTGGLLAVSDVALSAADKMSKMTSASEKLALAQKLFGRGAGMAMVSFLAQGREAIEADIAAYEASGARLTNAQIEAGKKFENAKKMLGFSMTSLLNTFASEKAIASLTKVYVEFTKLIQNETVKAALANISDAIRLTLDLIRTMLGKLNSFFEEHKVGITNVMDAIGYAVGYIIGVLQGFADRTEEHIGKAKASWQQFKDWIETPIDEDGVIGSIHLLIRLLPALSFVVSAFINNNIRGFYALVDVIRFVVDEIDGFLTIIGKLTGIHWEDAVKPALKASALQSIPGYGTIIGAGDAMQGWNSTDDYLKKVQTDRAAAESATMFAPTNTINVTVSQTNASPDDIANKVNEALENMTQNVMESIKGQR